MSGPTAWTRAAVETYVSTVLRERGKPYTGADFQTAVAAVWGFRP